MYKNLNERGFFGTIQNKIHNFLKTLYFAEMYMK